MKGTNMDYPALAEQLRSERTEEEISEMQEMEIAHAQEEAINMMKKEELQEALRCFDGVELGCGNNLVLIEEGPDDWVILKDEVTGHEVFKARHIGLFQTEPHPNRNLNTMAHVLEHAAKAVSYF